MSSRSRFALILLPVVLGSIVFAIGFNMRQQAKVAITPRDPPIYGIMAFSSLNFELEKLGGIIWIEDVKENRTSFLNNYQVSVTSPLDEEVFSEEQIIGFQFPYRVELAKLEEAIREGDIKITGWSEIEPDIVTIEAVDSKVHMIGETSIVYIKFFPLPGIENYDFEFWFICRDAIIQETFSTYSLYIPISVTENNVFVDYFSNLNYSIQLLPFADQHRIEVSTWLPPGSQVIDIYPPLAQEMIVSHPRDEDDGYQADRLFSWIHNLNGWALGPSPQPKSQVLRINFEMREDVDRYDRLLFESGILVGIGVSNIIPGFYAILREIAEKSRRVEN